MVSICYCNPIIFIFFLRTKDKIVIDQKNDRLFLYHPFKSTYILSDLTEVKYYYFYRLGRRDRYGVRFIFKNHSNLIRVNNEEQANQIIKIVNFSKTGNTDVQTIYHDFGMELKYFTNYFKRKRKAYYEIQRGTSHFEFIKLDSLYLADETFKNLNLQNLFTKVLGKNYSSSKILIDQDAWENIMYTAQEMGKDTLRSIQELNKWLKKQSTINLKTTIVITIIGL